MDMTCWSFSNGVRDWADSKLPGCTRELQVPVSIRSSKNRCLPFCFHCGLGSVRNCCAKTRPSKHIPQNHLSLRESYTYDFPKDMKPLGTVLASESGWGTSAVGIFLPWSNKSRTKRRAWHVVFEGKKFCTGVDEIFRCHFNELYHIGLAVFVGGKGHQVWLRKKHLYARHFLHFLVAWHFILGSTLSRVHIYVLKWNFWCLGTCLILHARNLFECRSLCLEPTRITHAHVAAACAGHKCRWRVASCVWATFTHTPATLHAILYIS